MDLATVLLCDISVLFIFGHRSFHVISSSPDLCNHIVLDGDSVELGLYEDNKGNCGAEGVVNFVHIVLVMYSELPSPLLIQQPAVIQQSFPFICSHDQPCLHHIQPAAISLPIQPPIVFPLRIQHSFLSLTDSAFISWSHANCIHRIPRALEEEAHEEAEEEAAQDEAKIEVDGGLDGGSASSNLVIYVCENHNISQIES
ncbi:hypothetical protein KSP40_PGU015117 [Platanthera guangdongensis]|uniref:Uncharacterized protein n=1 Tax=Platanthera guangdongensis TaxID=2320717 RepID=A0ABR2MXU8_9ASPA